MIHYSHTNLIAKDVSRMISFYRDVLGCQSIGETRDLSGEWVERRLGAITSLDRLESLGDRLLVVGSWDELLAEDA